MTEIPGTQYAVQLVGPDELVLNKSKQVFEPGPHQILARVEAVGLCFSDLKLLKQFSSHVRKGPLVSGIDPAALDEIPSYVPGDEATVPGHEVVVTIESVGPGVKHAEKGKRYLVQTDYRWLRTATSNGAFGYNFEGALQEFVLMDERVITSPEGDSMLLPVGDELAASAIALVEPWACVEDAYASSERTAIRPQGHMLVVADAEAPRDALDRLFARFGRPARITWLSKTHQPLDLGIETTRAADLEKLPDAAFDDILYFGSDPAVVEVLFAKVAARGILNIALCGGRFGRHLTARIGRVHYGGIRIVGTTGSEPAEAMEIIPEGDEIRPRDKVNVIGAGGPMGMMHTIRNICQGVEGVSVYAGDVDDKRLEMLTRIAAPLAEKFAVPYTPYNALSDKPDTTFDYSALMAPVPALAAAAVGDAAERGLINIFAGIPATVSGELDLDTYIEKRLYFIGTSGSTLDDMKLMLEKAQSGRLDTNVSVAAVSGMEGATEGIRAVENRSIAGKIIVYPACRDLGLVTLDEMPEKMPLVAECLEDGLWTKKAELKLLETHAAPR